MELVVATVGRPHGLHGEVYVDARTDEPESRFAVGQVLTIEPGRGHVTVASARQHLGRWLLQFDEVTDRTAAEALNHANLTITAGDSTETDAWYAHELVGMAAQLRDGTVVGEIAGIDHGTAHDFLVLREKSGIKTLIPFVREIVPSVDKETKVVTLNPPGGLLASDADRLVVSEETGTPAAGRSAAGAGGAIDNSANDADRQAEEAAEHAAPLAPAPGTKLPGEIAGTIAGEDIDTHQHVETADYLDSES